MSNLLPKYAGIVLLASSLSFTSCSTSEQNSTEKKVSAEFDLANISGKSPAELEAVFGKGSDNGVWKDAKSGCEACPKINYHSDSVEVIFIDGKSDRITLNGLSRVAFDDASILGTLGLPEASPTFGNADTKRWENYKGYKEISAFGVDGKVDYVLVESKAN